MWNDVLIYSLIMLKLMVTLHNLTSNKMQKMIKIGQSAGSLKAE